MLLVNRREMFSLSHESAAKYERCEVPSESIGDWKQDDRNIDHSLG